MSDSDNTEVEVEGDSQLRFVLLLQEKKVLLDKSQLPEMKAVKSSALSDLQKLYELNFGKPITGKQLMKKIHNMKTDIKNKTDKNKTGNKKIILKEWEKLMLKLLDGDINPVFCRLQGGQSCGLPPMQQPRTTPDAMTEDKVVDDIPPKKKSKPSEHNCNLPETEETKHLTTGQLQRLVLLEQLKLIRMQQQRLVQADQLISFNIDEAI